MRIHVFATVAALCLTSSFPATAESTPKPGNFDSRVTYIDYNPDDVVRLQGAFMASTLIKLSDDETILAITAGDTIGWEIQPIGNNIVGIKPREKPMPATMQVVTTGKDVLGAARQRIYTFMLTAKSGFIRTSTKDVQFILTFRYPEDEAARKAMASEQAELQDDLDSGTAESARRRNLDFLVGGASSLEPTEAFDNGRFTYLRYPGNRPIPAVYETDALGNESLVNFHVEGEWLVVHETAQKLTLRKGAAVLCLFNKGFDPVGTSMAPNKVETPLVKRATKPTPKEAKTYGVQP